jgi:hypothetical protein
MLPLRDPLSDPIQSEHTHTPIRVCGTPIRVCGTLPRQNTHQRPGSSPSFTLLVTPTTTDVSNTRIANWT